MRFSRIEWHIYRTSCLTTNLNVPIRFIVFILVTYPKMKKNGYNYGRGVLKIEPGALKNSIVYLKDDPCINTIYNKVSRLISSGEKFESMIISTKFLNEKFNIKQSYSDEAFSALLELQNRRLKKPLFLGVPCDLKN